MAGDAEPSVLRPDGEDNGWLGRGDIFVGLDLTGTAAEHHLEWDHRTGLLVLDHECQIEKPRTDHVLCTAVIPIAVLDVSNQGNVRSGRVFNAMHLGLVPDLGECFADFRFMARIPKAFLLKGVERGSRVASMSEAGLAALPYLIFRYFARTKPVDP